MKVIAALFLGLSVAAAAWVSVGPDGGYVQALAIDPARPQTLFAAIYDYPENARLFRTDNAGASWTLVSRIPYSTITMLQFDPHDSMYLYAGARTNTLYRSTDRGRNWTQLSMPGYASAFDPDPLVPGRLFAGGYYYYNSAYRSALYVSTNRGTSWTISMPRPDTVLYSYACAADPTATGHVYLASTYGYVHLTTDAGATWTLANSGLPSNSYAQSLTVSSAGVALAATGTGIYRTTNSGANWTLTTNSPGSASFVQYCRSDAGRAWSLGRSDSIRVFVSTDAGSSWRQPIPGYSTGKAATLVPDPGTGTVAYVSGPMGIVRSTDMGANWQTAHTGLRIAKISTIAAGPWNSERVYLEVAENGVYKSANRGLDWTRCNDFLSCGNICGIGVQPGTDGDVLYALEGSG